MFMHSIERPTATVRGASVSSAGFTGISGTLQLDVMNPNNFGVPISGIDWQLAVGGSRAVTGTVQLSQTIPARGVAPITTSLTIAASDALSVAAVIASGARDYTITAQLHFSTTVGQIDVDVRYAGTVDGSTAGSLFGLR
jgi:LEA14-like dessication related protein